MALEVEIQQRLPGLDLEVRFRAEGRPLGILGASGSGKTMTLRAIAGLETPARGRIALNGRTLFDSASRLSLPSRERGIGLLFQHYALFPHMTVAENVAFGMGHLPSAERARRAELLLARVHLEEFAGRYPAALSGGQQQRVALARALAIEPRALLLDEPFSALDTHLRSQLERQLLEILAEYRGVTLFVSHNLEEVYRVCGDLLVLSRGKGVVCGPKEEIFRRPPSVEIARLTGCKNFSVARAAGPDCVEALDWGCTLRVAQPPVGPGRHAAIRAHHIRFADLTGGAPAGENVFPAWLADTSETPFRMTLYLCLYRAPAHPADYHLQAEVYKEKWALLKDRPFPWRVALDPDRLMLLPD